MPNDKELLQQAFDFFCHYIKINEIVQDELQAEAEMILNAIQARLAQPEPDPVAWQVKFSDDEGIPQIAWFPHPVHPESNLAKRPYIEESLYTAPQKKEWVGLTDEEIINIWAGVSTGYDDEINIVHLGKVIEAKLKEKNGMD